MARYKKKSQQKAEYQDAELNIMPFIDVFSVLNTFLLMSAAFIAFGTLKVQVPFLSNKKTNEDDKPKRTMTVKVEMERSAITLITAFSLPPTNETKQTYTMDETGYDQLHKKLVEVRQQNPETDLVTAYTEDDVLYENVIKVIDAIKTKRPSDPEFKSVDPDDEKKMENGFIFPKVVMGSVIL